jgi:hypothetical protein
MSRTRKGSKAPGYEFWSPRPGQGGVGSIAKKITHRAERNANKREVRRAVRED